MWKTFLSQSPQTINKHWGLQGFPHILPKIAIPSRTVQDSYTQGCDGCGWGGTGTGMTKPRPFPTWQVQNRDLPKTNAKVLGLGWDGWGWDGNSLKGFEIWD